MRNYHSWQRERIWAKVLHIRRAYPGLTLKDISSQITTLRGGYFHLKYFQRLEDRSLGDSLTNDVVEWINDKFDDSFSASFDALHLIDFQYNFKNSIVFNYSGLKWQNCSADLHEGMRMAILKNDTMQCYPSLSELDTKYSYLSFCPNCKIIQCRPKSIGNFTEIYFEYYGKIMPFNGTKDNFSKLSNHVAFSVNDHTVLDLCVFILEYLEDTNGLVVHNINSVFQVLLYNQPNANIKYENFINIYEAASVSFQNDDLVCVSFDFISEDSAYRRYVFKINQKAMTYDFSFITVIEDLTKILQEDKTVYSFVTINTPPQSQAEIIDLSDLHEIISMSARGRLILRLLDFNVTNLIMRAGTQNSVSYIPQNNTVALIYRQDKIQIKALAALLVFGLDQAAQELAGLKAPALSEFPTDEEMKNFSGFHHGRILDAITSVCIFVGDMLKLSGSDGSASDYFQDGTVSLYNAWATGADREQLYEVYAEFFNKLNKR